MMANAKAREANFKSLDTRSRIEQLVRTSSNALGAARGRVPVLEQAVDSSGKVITAFEEQYLNANRPLFDLLDAYERSYASRSDLARVVLSESQASHTLYQQMGELVAALKQSENRIQEEPDAKPEPQPEAKAPSEPPLPEAAPRTEVQREGRR
jgi:outer membrane protein TolC